MNTSSQPAAADQAGRRQLLRLCVVRRWGARLELQVGGNAIALAFHSFHGQPQPFTLLRGIRVGGQALLIAVGRLLVLVAGGYLVRNRARSERSCESEHPYHAHAVLPRENTELLSKRCPGSRAQTRSERGEGAWGPDTPVADIAGLNGPGRNSP